MPLDAVLHDTPICQIFALNACHSWGQGLDLAGPSYEDLEMHKHLAAILAAKASAEPLTTES